MEFPRDHFLSVILYLSLKLPLNRLLDRPKMASLMYLPLQSFTQGRPDGPPHLGSTTPFRPKTPGSFLNRTSGNLGHLGL